MSGSPTMRVAPLGRLLVLLIAACSSSHVSAQPLPPSPSAADMDLLQNAGASDFQPGPSGQLSSGTAWSCVTYKSTLLAVCQADSSNGASIAVRLPPTWKSMAFSALEQALRNGLGTTNIAPIAPTGASATTTLVLRPPVNPDYTSGVSTASRSSERQQPSPPVSTAPLPSVTGSWKDVQAFDGAAGGWKVTVISTMTVSVQPCHLD
jgi:hypothetical protein